MKFISDWNKAYKGLTQWNPRLGLLFLKRHTVYFKSVTLFGRRCLILCNVFAGDCTKGRIWNRAPEAAACTTTHETQKGEMMKKLYFRIAVVLVGIAGMGITTKAQAVASAPQ